MEVTTVSPSPASPTEGDDLCEIDVTNVATHSVALLICLCGLAGNGAVVCFLSLESRNYGTFILAVTDFIFLLFTVPSALLFLVEDMTCLSIMPLLYVNMLFQLSVVPYYWVLFWLLFRQETFYIHVVFKFCCRCDLPGRLVMAVIAVHFWLYFALFTVIPVLTYLCPSHEQRHCRAAHISIYAVILLLFAAPVVMSRTIKIIKARCGSKKQQPKRRDIVTFIIVLLTLLLILCNFLQQLDYAPVSTQDFFLLICILSSIKPFIYFLVGRCWSRCYKGSLQLSLQRVFDEKKENTDHSNDANTDTVV